MTGTKTNERPGTRAVVRGVRMSATKARQVLDLIRDEEVGRAAEILRDCPRAAAEVVAKALASAVANASNNDDLEPDELYVAACFADEGPTLRRFRPRARGRATRIRKRSCHVTVIVAELPEERLRRHRTRREAEQAALRARRVAGGRRGRAGGEVAGSGRTEESQAEPEVGPSPTEVSDAGVPGAEPSGAGMPAVETGAVEAGAVEVAPAGEAAAGPEDAAGGPDVASSAPAATGEPEEEPSEEPGAGRNPEVEGTEE